MDTEPNTPGDDLPWTWRRCALWMLVLCVPLFLVGLGHYDLDSKAEPREGLTAWEMIHSGDWMLPSLNGQQLPEKPLMFPWLVAVATMLIGEASEWATRLPAALSAVALVFVVLALGRRLLGPRGGFVTALVFASTFLVISLARRARVDMTLAFFVTLAVHLFICDFKDAEEGRPAKKGRIALFWLAMALGTLTKGPLGAILPGLAVGPFLLARWRFGYLKRLFAWWGVLLFVVVAGSWYAYGVSASGDAFAYRSFLMENFMMFFGEAKGGGHRHETTYFIGHLFVMGLPWSFVLPAAVAWSLRRGGEPWKTRATTLPFVWFTAMFVFFSIAAGKRADYLLPLLPASALLVAAMLDDAPRAFAGRWVRGMAFAGAAVVALIGVAGVALGAAALSLPPERWPADVAAMLSDPEVRAVIERLDVHPALLALGAAGALVALCAPLICVIVRDGRIVRAALAAAAGAAVAASCAAFTVMPAIVSVETLKPFALDVEKAVPPGETIRNYQDFQPAVLFYLRRRAPLIASVRGTANAAMKEFLAEPGVAYFLTDEESWDRLRPEMKARLEVAVGSDRPNMPPTDEPVLVRRR